MKATGKGRPGASGAENGAAAAASIPTAPVSAWVRYGPAICGVGMLAFAAAVGISVTMRLGWWDSVDRTEGGDGNRPRARQPVGDDPAKAAPAGDPVNRLAFGPLAGELAAEHPPTFYQAMGTFCLTNKEYRLAARQFSAAHTLYASAGYEDPAKRQECARQMAGALWQARAQGEALTALREEIALSDPAQVPFPLMQEFGLMSLNAGQTAEAMKILSKLLQTAPGERERAWAREHIWKAHRQSGAADQVLAQYRDQIAARPDHEESLRMLLAYHTGVQPNPAEAGAVLEKLIALHPAEPELGEMLFQSLKAQKRTDDLLKLVERLAAAQPDRAVHFWGDAADYLVSVQLTDKARALVREKLEADPQVHGPARAAAFHRAVKEPAAAAVQYAIARGRALNIDAIQAYQLDEADCRFDAGQVPAAKALVMPLLESAHSPANRARAKLLLKKIELGTRASPM